MNPIPDMEKPSGQSEAYDLTYFDGHKRRVYVTDDQFYLTNTMMIFSRTDTKGFITMMSTNTVNYCCTFTIFTSHINTDLNMRTFKFTV